MLTAPANWQTLAFMSDVHLHPADAATFQCWQNALLRAADFDALFILGDLFEVWVGDDVLDDPDQGGFWRTCTHNLHAVSKQVPILFMPGNRDFLVGERLLEDAGMSLLADPTVLQWGDQRWVLSHGDALCLSDEPYQAFRSEVRRTAWQNRFLQQPLDARLAMARHMRDASEQRKAVAASWSDVDTTAALHLLHTCDASVLLHGHTHMPATHTLGSGLTRHVLTDWDAACTQPRGDLLCVRRGDHFAATP